MLLVTRRGGSCAAMGELGRDAGLALWPIATVL